MKKILEEGYKKILFRLPILRLIIDPILDYQLNKKYKQYNEVLKTFKDKHKGERCFIIGTGPSLNKTNTMLLKNEINWGVNRLIETSKDIGIDCRYYGLTSGKLKVDTKMLNAIDGTLFLFRLAARRYLKENKKSNEKQPIPVKTEGLILGAKHFPKDISKYIHGGGRTIIIPCLQMAYHMGFKEVYLVGCDCNYSGKAHFDGQKRPFKEKDDEEHWNTVFKAYEICKEEYEIDGRKIYNATVGGELEVFERRKLEDVII
ncbi:MAG: DUF115 domain-containing protein [Thermoplasmatales archaeon]|nr:MAG: DUF115 domain-containing protein [Thermoplasmatales archaeon]